MIYLVKINLNDDDILNLNIPDTMLDPLFDSLKEEKIFWTNQEKKWGLWINASKVKCAQILEQEENINGKPSDQNEIPTSESELQCETICNPNRERDVESP